MATLNVPDPSSPQFSQSRVYIPMTVACICIATCLVFASLRFYVRWFLIRKVSADDWALLWSVVRSPLAGSLMPCTEQNITRFRSSLSASVSWQVRQRPTRMQRETRALTIKRCPEWRSTSHLVPVS